MEKIPLRRVFVTYADRDVSMPSTFNMASLIVADGFEDEVPVPWDRSPSASNILTCAADHLVWIPHCNLTL